MESVNRWLRRVPTWTIYLAGLLWAAFVFWQAVTGAIGVDPVRELEHALGLRALQLLIFGLAITPLRRFTGLNLLRFRRAIGLTAFGLTALHLMAWFVFDIGLNWAAAGADILKRPYITIGMAGFVLLIPLAMTSNNLSIRRLGPQWRRLHRLTYAAVLAGGVHYLMVVKSWPMQPMVYCALILVLLGLRFWPKGVRTGRKTADSRE